MARARGIAFGCGFVALGLIVACGSADDTQLRTPSSGGTAGTGASGGASGAAGGGGSVAGSAGAGAGGVSGSGGTGAAAGDGGTAGVGTDASATGGTGASVGGASGAAGDGGAGAPGGTGGSGGTGVIGPTPGVVQCGQTLSCSLQNDEKCCLGDNVAASCVDEVTACTCTGLLCGSRSLQCDDAVDCNGGVCCAERGLTSGAWDRVSCRPTCTSDAPVGTTRAVLCKVGARDCPNGRVCQADAKLGRGLGTCPP
jgi:hypothetical protein